MLFDSHTHYTDKKFDVDREEMLSSLAGAGVGTVIACPSTPDETETCLLLAEKYPFVYAAAGLHPHECGEYGEEALQKIRELANHPKCVAIGETGLDYHYDFSPREAQKLWFHRLCELAVELDKPVIVHDREAHRDVLDILKATRPRGVMHCYSGSAEMVPEYIKLGLYISFAGTVTFKNAPKLWEAAKAVPSGQLLIETDCPYLAPEPVRGRRNDSRNLTHIVGKLAELRGVSALEIETVTEENARELFRIGK